MFKKFFITTILLTILTGTLCASADLFLKKKIQIETEGRRRREESEAFSSGEVLRARVR